MTWESVASLGTGMASDGNGGEEANAIGRGWRNEIRGYPRKLGLGLGWCFEKIIIFYNMKCEDV